MADRELRVRHLLKGLGPGGAERLVVAQATSSLSSGIKHEVLYLLTHKRHLVPELEDAGVPTTCLDADHTIALGWIRALRSKLMSDPVDILHVHSPALAVASRLMLPTIPRRVRPCLVDTEHNRWPRHHPLTRLANRATIRFNSATIAVSDDVKGSIRGIDPERVLTIIHGIDLEAVRATADRESARTELGVGSNEILVATVANLRREKALPVLIEAARRSHVCEPRLRFVLVGQGPLADEVDRLVGESGLGDAFLVLGYRSDATRIVSGADIFTLSSRHEGLPVSIMESLALGVPIVATDAGGTAEATGPAGTIVEVDDIDGLATAWVDLARNPNRRAQLSVTASEQAERFSIQRSVAEIERVYYETAEPTGERPNNHS